MMRDDQADRLIELLTKLLDRFDRAQVLVTTPAQSIPGVWPQLHDVTPRPYTPNMVPFIQPMDCGCPSNTVCMNVSCPRATRIVVSSVNEVLGDPRATVQFPTTVA